jgi:hypothetical protein
VTLRIGGGAHTRNDLPFAASIVEPGVDNAKASGLVCSILVSPGEANTIRDRSVLVRYLRLQAFQVIRLETLTFAGMSGDELGDLFFAYRFRAVKPMSSPPLAINFLSSWLSPSHRAVARPTD